MSDAAYISNIERYLVDKLKTVFKNVYAGHLPSTLPPQKTAFVVVDCSATISNYDAYHKGIIAIYLYAMPSANLKDVAKLARMEKKYTEKFLSDCDSDDYTITEVYRTTDYDSTYGMDFIYSAINLIVK